MWILFLTLHSNWPFIGCQVCILTNEVVTCGLDFACVALDLKLDQSAINETKGTKMQFYETVGLKCNLQEFGPLKLKLNWSVLKIGIGHFCNKNVKFWTKLQLK